MSVTTSGRFTALGRSAVSEIKNSGCARAFSGVCSWCGRLVTNSLLSKIVLDLLTTQKQSPPGKAISRNLGTRAHEWLLKLFSTLKLNRLLENSLFTKPLLWCSLAVIAAPIVPTIVVLALVLASFGSLFLCFGTKKDLQFRYSPVNKWVVLYAAVYTMATALSVSPKGSLFVGMISVFFLLFYAVLTTVITRWSQLHHLLIGLTAAGVLVTLYGFWQYLHPAAYQSTWLDTDMFSSITLRVYSTLANPNVLGTYFLLLLPFVAALTLTAPGKFKKLVYAAAFLMIALCLVLTYSRGCWLGLLFAGCIFLVLLDPRFILVGIVLLAFSPLYLPDTIIERFTSIGNMADTSTSYRVYIWLGVLAMLKDYWFSGIGPGTEAFNQVYPLYSYSAIDAPHSHNLFLQIICDTGVIGILVFLILIISFYRCSFTALRKEKHKDARIFQIAAISAISGFLLEGMTDYTFYNYRVMFFFWAVLALGILFTKADELKAADLNGQTAWQEDADESQPRIKVLNIISDTNIGGAGRCLLNYLKYSCKDRYNVSVMLPKGSQLKPAVEAFGTPVIEADIQGDRSLDPKAIPVLRSMVAAMEPDIVHTHGIMTGRIAARGSHAKLIYSRHSAFPVPDNMKHGVRHWVNRLVNDLYADRIISVSPATMENLTDSGVRAEQIDIVMNGVEPVTPPDKAVTAAWREKCGIREGDFVVGILARLEEYKGHLLLLEAAAQLKKEGYHFKVLIAGKGDYEQQINDRLHALQLEDCVLNLGFTTDVAGFLSVLDVQANCSFGTEATSLSLLEGFSMKIPAVVSSYGGNPWLVEDGVNGLIFENKNSAALTDCLRRLMDDPGQLDAMRENAEKVFYQRFTGEIFAENIESVYQRVLNQ